MRIIIFTKISQTPFNNVSFCRNLTLRKQKALSRVCACNFCKSFYTGTIFNTLFCKRFLSDLCNTGDTPTLFNWLQSDTRRAVFNSFLFEQWRSLHHYQSKPSSNSLSWIIFRGGSRTAATSKMEHFLIIVNGFQPLTIITKRSILDVAAVLDPLLILSPFRIFVLDHFQRSYVFYTSHWRIQNSVKYLIWRVYENS